MKLSQEFGYEVLCCLIVCFLVQIRCARIISSLCMSVCTQVVYSLQIERFLLICFFWCFFLTLRISDWRVKLPFVDSLFSPETILHLKVGVDEVDLVHDDGSFYAECVWEAVQHQCFKFFYHLTNFSVPH